MEEGKRLCNARRYHVDHRPAAQSAINKIEQTINRNKRIVQLTAEKILMLSKPTSKLEGTTHGI